MFVYCVNMHLCVIRNFDRRHRHMFYHLFCSQVLFEGMLYHCLYFVCSCRWLSLAPLWRHLTVWVWVNCGVFCVVSCCFHISTVVMASVQARKNYYVSRKITTVITVGHAINSVFFALYIYHLHIWGGGGGILFFPSDHALMAYSPF